MLSGGSLLAIHGLMSMGMRRSISWILSSYRTTSEGGDFLRLLLLGVMLLVLVNNVYATEAVKCEVGSQYACYPMQIALTRLSPVLPCRANRRQGFISVLHYLTERLSSQLSVTLGLVRSFWVRSVFNFSITSSVMPRKVCLFWG